MKHFRVKPHARLRLAEFEADHIGGYKNKAEAAEHTEHLLKKLGKLQGRLYAEKQHAVLVVLQGIDTSGKDGTIRHVMSGVSPQGCLVTSFKAPTPAEKAHDYLWRVHANCPPLGYIGIFNRSHYEDVLITQVHQWITPKEVRRRIQQIRDFEKMLTENGTRILKFFLHISKKEQKKRFLARLENPEKRWKFEVEDLAERKYWKAYERAYEEVIESTTTEESPWFIVPADHKWFRNLVVAETLVNALEDIDPRPPKFKETDEKKLIKQVHQS